jgi:hypothetical protein
MKSAAGRPKDLVEVEILLALGQEAFLDLGTAEAVSCLLAPARWSRRRNGRSS